MRFQKGADLGRGVAPGLDLEAPRPGPGSRCGRRSRPRPAAGRATSRSTESSMAWTASRSVMSFAIALAVLGGEGQAVHAGGDVRQLHQPVHELLASRQHRAVPGGLDGPADPAGADPRQQRGPEPRRSRSCSRKAVSMRGAGTGCMARTWQRETRVGSSASAVGAVSISDDLGRRLLQGLQQAVGGLLAHGARRRERCRPSRSPRTVSGSPRAAALGSGRC